MSKAQFYDPKQLFGIIELCFGHGATLLYF